MNLFDKATFDKIVKQNIHFTEGDLPEAEYSASSVAKIVAKKYDIEIREKNGKLNQTHKNLAQHIREHMPNEGVLKDGQKRGGLYKTEDVLEILNSSEFAEYLLSIMGVSGDKNGRDLLSEITSQYNKERLDKIHSGQKYIDAEEYERQRQDSGADVTEEKIEHYLRQIIYQIIIEGFGYEVKMEKLREDFFNIDNAMDGEFSEQQMLSFLSLQNCENYYEKISQSKKKK